MIKSMRSAVQSWSMKLLLLAIVVSFISFYGYQMGGGTQSGGVIVEVNGEGISSNEFQYRYQMLLRVYQQYGLIQDTNNEGMMQMLQENVLRALIEEELMKQEARELGFVASPAALRDQIKTQLFGDQPFDMDLYRNYLRGRLNTTRKKFEEAQARTQLASRFSTFITSTAYIPEEELRETFELRNSKVNLTYLSLTPENMKRALPKIAVTEGGLQTYFENNKARYQEDEKRKLEIASLDVSDLLTPTQTDLSDTLESMKDAEDLAGPRIRASHILLKTEGQAKKEVRQKARKLYEDIKAGASLETMARKHSQDSTKTQGGDLGYFGKGRMVESFEKAAFQAKEGELIGPVESQFGFHIIKVTDRIEPGEVSIDRLKDELALTWRRNTLLSPEKSKAYFDDARARLTTVKTGLDTGKGFEKLASADPLIEFTRTDYLSPGGDIAGIEDGPQLSRTAQTMEEGSVSNPIRGFRSKKMYVFRVAEKKEAETPSLSEIEEEVRSDFLEEKRLKQLKSFAQAQLKRLQESQTTMGGLAKELGISVRETGEFSQSGAQSIPGIGKSEELMREVFSKKTEKEFLSKPYTVEDKIILASVKNRIKPDWKLFESQKSELQRVSRGETQNFRRAEFINRLCSEATIKNNLSDLTARCGQSI